MRLLICISSLAYSYCSFCSVPPFNYCNTAFVTNCVYANYKNNKLNIEFKYPGKLKISEKNGVIKLNHSIPYEKNPGGCDMSATIGYSNTLDDFNITLEIKNSNTYNISIQFKMNLQSLIDKPKELLELINDCLKPKESEKKH